MVTSAELAICVGPSRRVKVCSWSQGASRPAALAGTSNSLAAPLALGTAPAVPAQAALRAAKGAFTGRAKAEKIWFRALDVYFTSNTSYVNTANPANTARAYQQLRQATLGGTLEVPHIRFDKDIGGYAKVKEQLRNEVLNLLARKDLSLDTAVTISSGCFRRYAIPSLLYISAAVMARSPEDDRRWICALRASITGARSVELTAQHRGLPGATQHMSPSFFKQKWMERRHSSVWS